MMLPPSWKRTDECRGGKSASPGFPLAALFLSSHPSGYITGRIAARGADPGGCYTSIRSSGERMFDISERLA